MWTEIRTFLTPLHLLWTILHNKANVVIWKFGNPPPPPLPCPHGLWMPPKVNHDHWPLLTFFKTIIHMLLHCYISNSSVIKHSHSQKITNTLKNDYTFHALKLLFRKALMESDSPENLRGLAKSVGNYAPPPPHI